MPYSRFKEVNDRANTLEERLEQLEEERKEKEKEELEQKEKFKELYQKTQEEKEEIENQLVRTRKESALVTQASQANAKDPNDIVRFVDLDKVELDDEGRIQNAKEVIGSLTESKPYLFGSSENIGSDAGSSQSNKQGRVWKWSELKEKRKDQSWYEDHEEEIRKAREEGRIDYSK